MDRYAYADNNPVMKNDPSGHYSCNSIPDASARETCKNARPVDEQLNDYGVKLSGKWTATNQAAVLRAVQLVGSALAAGTNDTYETGSDAFNAVYGGVTFTWGDCPECLGQGAYTYSQHNIHFVSMAQEWRSDYELRQTNNVIHELGHAFNWAMSRTPELLLTNDTDKYKQGFNALLLRKSDPNSYSGFASRNSERTWVQNPDTSATEVFADQFLGWVRNTWETDPSNRYSKWSPAGAARSKWMTTNMTDWLNP